MFLINRSKKRTKLWHGHLKTRFQPHSQKIQLFTIMILQQLHLMLYSLSLLLRESSFHYSQHLKRKKNCVDRRFTLLLGSLVLSLSVFFQRVLSEKFLTSIFQVHRIFKEVSDKLFFSHKNKKRENSVPLNPQILTRRELFRTIRRMCLLDKEQFEKAHSLLFSYLVHMQNKMGNKPHHVNERKKANLR